MRFLLLFLVLACIGAAIADPYSPTNLQVLNSTSRILPQSSNGSIDAQAGNVTEVNIEAITVTRTWQGYFGNVTGNLLLDDGNNQTFYAWGNVTASGEIYASRNDTILWSTINCTNATGRAGEDTYLGRSATDGDSVLNTFNGTTHPSFLVGVTNITQDSCYSTNVNVNNAPQTGAFHQILLSDDDQNLVYSTIIEDAQQGFNGQAVDFQLLVGENGNTGNEGTTTYFFFVELS